MSPITLLFGRQCVIFALMSDTQTDRKTLGLFSRYSANGPKREQAYNQLRRLLILQQIPEGTRLTESEWIHRLGVNRTALREAFARLQAEGLIELGPKTGYFVPTLTINDINEMIAVRFALESIAIEIICKSGENTPEHLKRMQDSCDLLERLVVEDYELSTVEADLRFHEALIQATDNKRLAIAYRNSPLLILHPDITYGPRWANRVRQTLDEHRALLVAILNGDVHRARELLRSHLMGYWETREGTKSIVKDGAKD